MAFMTFMAFMTRPEDSWDSWNSWRTHAYVVVLADCYRACKATGWCRSIQSGPLQPVCGPRRQQGTAACIRA